MAFGSHKNKQFKDEIIQDFKEKDLELLSRKI
jgi:hypothetical protein